MAKSNDVQSEQPTTWGKKFKVLGLGLLLDVVVFGLLFLGLTYWLAPEKLGWLIK